MVVNLYLSLHIFIFGLSCSSPLRIGADAISGAISVDRRDGETSNLGPLISKVGTELGGVLEAYEKALRVKPDSYASKVAEDPQLLKVLLWSRHKI